MRVPVGMELDAKVLGPLHVCIARLALHGRMASRHIARSRCRRWGRTGSAASCEVGRSIVASAMATLVQEQLKLFKTGALVERGVPSRVKPDPDVSCPRNGRKTRLA